MKRSCSDPRELAPEILARRVKNNPYIQEILQYPDQILIAPEAAEFKQWWQRQRLDQRPVFVEMGTGSGKFLMQLCQRHPECFVIGFELRFKRSVLTARKLRSLEINNALLLRQRGEEMRHYFQPRSIDRFYINFPDPWPKPRHHKNRFLRPAFFEMMESLLRPEGTIHFKTDHREYFQTVVKLVRSLPAYEVLEYAADLHQSPFVAENLETEFEQLFRSKHKLPIGHLKVRLTSR